MATEKHPRRSVLQVPLPTSTNPTSTTLSNVRVPYGSTVVSVTYSPNSAVTGANSNYRTLSLINHRQDGSGSAVVAQQAFLLGVNAAAFDEKPIPLSATAANLALAEGDILEQQSVPTGAGFSGPGGTMCITIELA